MIAAAIVRTREEITALKQGQEAGRTSDELQAVVAGTEQATHRILAALEIVDELAARIRKQSEDPSSIKTAQDIQSQMQIVFEACNFQDLTGQRISKVVKTMAFIEGRIGEMLRIWGRANLVTTGASVRACERTGEAALLNGPPLPGEAAVSQANIDALFV
ncbi:protein phosphatase CheZ [uncultured Methylobacterium sp.]|uniref:protein phosphatase CheZ n=1 Tax=uncultured Methylobacterium sp. TaxID=157278 RepID=UPI002599E06B|nr:protein phosphatase CheZ [uncultured Methylobacterium sp.]